MDKLKMWKKIVAVCLILVILAIILLLIYRFTGLNKLKVEDIKDYIASLGAWGPWMFILICFLQVTIVPIPSNIVI